MKVSIFPPQLNLKEFNLECNFIAGEVFLVSARFQIVENLGGMGFRRCVCLADPAPSSPQYKIALLVLSLHELDGGKRLRLVAVAQVVSEA